MALLVRPRAKIFTNRLCCKYLTDDRLLLVFFLVDLILVMGCGT
jgi:hypothetical protein